MQKLSETIREAVTILFLVLKKIESEGKTKYDTFFSHSKAETITNESDIDDAFESIYTAIMSNMQKSLGKVSSWIIDSVKSIILVFESINLWPEAVT